MSLLGHDSSELMEVGTAVVHTLDGEAHHVEGGAYLSPQAYLMANAELTRLREREYASMTPVVVGAALVGLAVGYWLGRRD